MQRVSGWLSVCQLCGLYTSELEPGPGKAFDGIESLRKKNFDQVLNSIEKIKPLPKVKLLEIGSAKGWFLAAAQRRGADVSGVEPVSADAEVARESGFSVEEGLFPESPKDRGPYDIIVFNDVFEHIPDPVHAARSAADLLSPGGLLVINIPSSRGVVFKVAEALHRFGVSGPYERLWQKGLPSPHMTYFTPQNLKALIEKHTPLRRRASHPLLTLDRDGLRQRIDSSSTGIPGPILFGAAWLASFALPLLPSDIELSIFSNDNFPRE